MLILLMFETCKFGNNVAVVIEFSGDWPHELGACMWFFLYFDLCNFV